MTADVRSLVAESHRIARDRGWWDDGQEKTFIEAVMLVVSEAAEAVEEYRHGRGLTEVHYETGTNGLPKPCGIPSELADIVIRTADLCGRWGIDLDAAIAEKLAYNATRPYRHGGMRA